MTEIDKTLMDVKARLETNLALWETIRIHAQTMLDTGAGPDDMISDLTRIVGISARWIAHHTFQMEADNE